MKKNIYLGACFILLTFGVHAQNLVVNPSFENTNSDCANFGGEGFFTDLSTTWNNASNNVQGDSCSSPDLFAPCNVIFGDPAPTNMPSSMLGFQYSRTGTRHVGIITHEPLSDYREYIQGRTSAPLIAGQTYCVSFYVSRGDDTPYATDNMGVFFSETEYLRDPCPGTSSSLINETPQLNYDCDPITDTTNWVRLQWDYTATGGEQYFVIGNFYNNANTNIQNVGGGGLGLNPYAYYFIDDVSIVADACCAADLVENTVVCASDPAFDLEATGGTGSLCSTSLNGTWSGNGITNATDGTFDPAVAGAGMHTVTYTLDCGFTTTTTVLVSACAALTACVEENGDITVSGGTGPYTWEHEVLVEDCSDCIEQFPFPPCSFPSGCSVEVPGWEQFANGASATPSGNWPIRVLDSDGGVLEIQSASELATCSGEPPCALSVEVVTVQGACDGEDNGSITVAASGNIGVVTYQWDTDPAQTSATASGLPMGSYTVTVSDQQGCTVQETISLEEESITVDAGEDQIICKGESAMLGATGAETYVWNNGGGNGQTVEVFPGSTTTYTVTGTGANGCPSTDEVTIEVYQTPVAEFQIEEDTLCLDDMSLILSANPSEGAFSGSGVQGSTFDPAVAGEGMHVVSYTYYEVEECPVVVQDSVQVEECVEDPGPGTGIEEGGLIDDMRIMPNPTDGQLLIEYTGEESGEAVLTLTDLTGRVVMTHTVGSIKALRLPLDLTSEAAGQYLLQVDLSGERLGTVRITRN